MKDASRPLADRVCITNRDGEVEWLLSDATTEKSLNPRNESIVNVKVLLFVFLVLTTKKKLLKGFPSESVVYYDIFQVMSASEQLI